MKMEKSVVVPTFLIGMVLLFGCVSTDPVRPAEPKAAYLPKEGRIRIRLSANTARGQVNLSRFVYVFPPLKVDSNKQVAEKLIPKYRENGELFWISPTQGALAIKMLIEESLRGQGYTPVTFTALTTSEEDHRVMVLNPYYSGRMEAVGNENGKVAYTRITIATYPASLAPDGRIEVINQEAAIIYHEADSHLDALKRAFDFSIRNIGINREWMTDISIKE